MLLDVSEGLPILYQEAGIGVPQVVKADAPQASLLIQHGESLAYVKEQMGHHSIQVSVDAYGRLIPGANKAAVDWLDSMQPDATYTQRGTDVELGGRLSS